MGALVYSSRRCGTNVRVSSKGRTTSAKKVKNNQMFSQCHLRACFIGQAKLPLAKPLINIMVIPKKNNLLIIGFYPRATKNKCI